MPDASLIVVAICLVTSDPANSAPASPQPPPALARAAQRFVQAHHSVVCVPTSFSLAMTLGHTGAPARSPSSPSAIPGANHPSTPPAATPDVGPASTVSPAASTAASPVPAPPVATSAVGPAPMAPSAGAQASVPPASTSAADLVPPAPPSCLRLDGALGPRLEGLLPHARVSVPPLDRPTILASLAAIEVALDREGAFQELQRSYSDLLGAHFTLRRRVANLEHELTETERSAAPFVTFVQARYDRLRGRLLESERIAAERLRALKETEGDAREIQRLRGRLRYEEGVHQDAVRSFQSRITSLEQELSSARTQASQARTSDSGAHRLHVRLKETNAALLLARQALTQSQNQVRALETSQGALEASVRILRQQSSTLERRATELRQQLTQEQTRSKHVLGQSLQERDRLQKLLDQSDLELQRNMTALRRACHKRDRIRQDSVQHRKFFFAPGSGPRS
jgi:hypothetical protein